MGNYSKNGDFTSERARAAGRKSSKALPEGLKELRTENKKKAELIFQRLYGKSVEELEILSKDKSQNAMEAAITKVLYESIKKGDQIRLQFILDRTVGPIVQKVEHDIDMHTELSLHERVVKAIKDSEK